MNYNDLLLQASKYAYKQEITNDLPKVLILMVREISRVGLYKDAQALKNCLTILFRVGASYGARFVDCTPPQEPDEGYLLGYLIVHICDLEKLQFPFNKSPGSVAWSFCLRAIEAYAKLKGMDISKLNLFEEA